MGISANESFAGYTVTRKNIARGCSSTVHEGLSSDGKTKVAIKILSSKIPSNRRKSRFVSEYETLARLRHPNIATVIEAGFDEGRPFIISEFAKGEHIARALIGLPPAQMIPTFIELLKGIDFIHRSGMLHLDIKSQNVIVSNAGEAPKVKILDFGLAIPAGEYRGELVGSPSTMAPEIVLGPMEKVGKTSDLYSAGILIYQCLSGGFHPFGRTLPNSPAKLREMIEAERKITARTESDHCQAAGLRTGRQAL